MQPKVWEKYRVNDKYYDRRFLYFKGRLTDGATRFYRKDRLWFKLYSWITQ